MSSYAHTFTQREVQLRVYQDDEARMMEYLREVHGEATCNCEQVREWRREMFLRWVTVNNYPSDAAAYQATFDAVTSRIVGYPVSHPPLPSREEWLMGERL